MEAEPTSPVQEKGELLASLTRELIGLHKRHYGRGATKAKALFAHDNLLLVEMEDVFLTMEHTLVAKGQREIVREARRTFQAAMSDEFIGAVESLTGRRVENYQSVTFTAPDRILEIFYLQPVPGADGSAPPVLYEADGVTAR
ncbi:MAG: Na-translocating system protein MpsC family protein [Solirubrobacterales bacterium]